MRLYKVLLSASILAASTVMLSSCLKNQEDIFDVDAANRLEQRLADCKNTLISSEHGWVFDYFPDRAISYGGYVYGLKFTENDVTVTCELAPGQTETSLYKMTNDNGPILSFDSYNTLMHFFATPSSSNYEAYDGDFEFIIMDVKPDIITLRGNRTGNTMYLRRLDSDPVQYVSQAVSLAENIFQTEFNGTCGSEAVYATNDLGVRFMEFQWKAIEKQEDGTEIEVVKTSGAYYVPTPTGIHFVEPVQLSANSGEVTDLAFNTSNFTFTGTDSNGNSVSLTGQVAASYSFYNEFIGNFTMTYGTSGALDVQIIDDGTGAGYLIKGITNVCDIKATYNKSVGGIDIAGQIIGEGTQDTWKFLGALATGNFYPNALGTIGMVAVKDVDNPNTYVFTDNGYASEPIVGFTIVQQRGTSYYYPSAPYLFTDGESEMGAPVKLIKK